MIETWHQAFALFLERELGVVSAWCLSGVSRVWGILSVWEE